MAARASLLVAAQNCADDLQVQTIAGTLASRLATFVTTAQPSFSDALANNHPVLDWIAVLSGFQAQMDGAANDYVEYRIATDYMYRLLFMASQSQTQTPALITAAQAAALLAAYNANFG